MRKVELEVACPRFDLKPILLAIVSSVAVAAAAEPAKAVEPMVVRWFPYLPPVMDCMRSYSAEIERAGKTPEQLAEEAAREKAEDIARWKEWFTLSCGVKWPEGSSLTVTEHPWYLRIRNTRAALETIEKRIAEQSETTVFELDLRYVKPSPAALEAVGWNDLTRPDAETLWRRLRQRGDAPIIAAPRTQTLGFAVVSRVKGVEEIIYPTDWDVVAGKGQAFVEPQAFAMREVGTRTPGDFVFSDTEPEIVFEAGRLIWTALEGWRNVGMSIPQTDGPAIPLKMETPLFGGNEESGGSVVSRFRVPLDKLFLCPTTGDVLVFGKVTKVKGVN